MAALDRLGLLGRLLGRRLTAGARQLVAHAAECLGRRQAAIADGGIHIVQRVEGQLAQQRRQQLRSLHERRVHAPAPQLALEAGLAVRDVLLALFLFEPLLDLCARLIGVADVQPIAARPLGGLGGQDLNDVAVSERLIEAGDPVVDLRADHGVADAGVDCIGKVDRRRAGGQAHDLALRGEDEDLVVEHIDLERVDVILGVVFLLLGFQQTAHPFKLLLVASGHALLVFPVGGDAVFGRLVHLPRADLHLEGDALMADDGRVERLIHIRLRRGDIVLEAPRHQIEQVMDVAENVIAVRDRIDDHAKGIHIIKLVDRLVLRLHLAIDGIDVLDAAVDRAVDAHGGQPRRDGRLDLLHEAVGLGLMSVEIGHDVVIAHGVEVFQAGVLQLPFDLLHTETVRQRGVDIHRLARFGDLLGRSLVFHRARVVQPVADLDEHHADVLAHGHEHLAQILHLLLLERGIFDARQLRDALDQRRDRLTELPGDLVIGRVGVLDAVVQDRAQDRVSVQPGLRNDLRDGQRMDDIRRAVLAELPVVLGARIVHRAVDDRKIGLRAVLRNGLHHAVIMILKGLHISALSLQSAVKRAVFERGADAAVGQREREHRAVAPDGQKMQLGQDRHAGQRALRAVARACR